MAKAISASAGIDAADSVPEELRFNTVADVMRRFSALFNAAQASEDARRLTTDAYARQSRFLNNVTDRELAELAVRVGAFLTAATRPLYAGEAVPQDVQPVVVVGGRLGELIDELEF